MTTSEIVGMVICGGVSVLLVVAAVFLLTGRGAWMVAGFNTLPPEEKDKYDVKALCRFTGKILLGVAVMPPLMVLSGILEMDWIAWCATAAVVALAGFAAVYCNTGERFRK